MTGRTLAIEGAWTPIVHIPEEPCDHEDCEPAPARDVASEDVSLELGSVAYRAEAAWIDIAVPKRSSPYRLTCDTFAREDILVKDGGGGPVAKAAVTQVLASIHGGAKALIRDGGKAENPRQGIEILLYPTASHPLADTFETALDRDLPGVDVSIREWRDAPASFVVVVGSGVVVPGR